MNKTFVIVGNGIAGLTAATTIRQLDRKCNIILIGDEPYLTYSRPMLTKASIIGFDISKFIVYDANWYRKNRITTIVNTKVVNICKDNKNVTLSNGDIIQYDKCIIATGAESFIPPIKGSDKKGVFVVRKIDDIAKMRIYRLKSKNAVVIGGGVIGLEVAWELKKSGLNVVVLEQECTLMGRLLDSQSAEVLKSIVKSQGIDVVNGVQVGEIFGDSKVKRVILKDGSEYKADIVLLSCGIKPNIDIAKKANIATNRSIVVDSCMKTNVQDIYACGDCAEYNGVNLGLWEQAINQAKIAAKNACEQFDTYDEIKTNLIFNGVRTSLYAIGDIGKEKNVKYKDLVRQFKNIKPTYFMINDPNNLRYSYEKYYFINNRIVGGVLISDLSKKDILKQSIVDSICYKEFIEALNKNKGEIYSYE